MHSTVLVLFLFITPLIPLVAGDTVARFQLMPSRLRWNRTIPMMLTCSLSPTAVPGYIPREEVEATLGRALAHWAEVIPVSYVQAVSYKEADVQIGFYAGDYGDGIPFDGKLGRLAHSFYPEDGRMHFDAAERWAVDLEKEEADEAIDLESIAVHEMGHVLGLGHSFNPDAVMYAFLGRRTRKVELDLDDILGAQALYGSNPNFRFHTRKSNGGDGNPRWYYFYVSVAVLVIQCL